MEWAWLGFAALGTWAMLTVFANEKQRQTQEADALERAKTPAKSGAVQAAIKASHTV